MITEIIVSSRNSTKDVINYKINKKIGIISIIDAENDILLTDEYKIRNKIENVPNITLWFNDLTITDYNRMDIKNQKIYKLFTKEMATDIINFVNNIKNEVEVLIVHCAAGICRSVAVGYFINRYLGLDEAKFLTTNCFIFPNRYVYDILCEVSGMRDQIQKDLEETFKRNEHEFIF